MSKIRYAVWGRDRVYRWLWLAALISGFDAAKRRYQKRTTHDGTPIYGAECKTEQQQKL